MTKSIFRTIILLTVLLLNQQNFYAYDFEVDGLCYNIIASDQVEVTYRSYQDGSYSGSLTIPEFVLYNDVVYHVTRIGLGAFSNCSGLVGELIIPNSVTYIDGYAFYHCSGLTGPLSIPNSVTSISGGAFDGCSGFTGTLTIPNSVTTIGVSAFQGCSGFTGSLTIPNSVTFIGDFAFSLCSGFNGELTLPNSITFIGQCTFQNCNFTGRLHLPSTVTLIGASAFQGCKFSGPLTISQETTNIDDNAFLSCHNFTSIIVEAGNTSYDSRNNCNAIIETNSNKLIAGCGSSTIPNSVTSIGDWAFSNCSALTSLNIPNSVTSIGQSAFNNCSGLLSISIPNSIMTIEDWTFNGCSSLSSITIPNSVTIIGNGAFSSSGLISITIPDGVTSIGQGVLYNCMQLSSVTLPNSLTSIGDEAFYISSSLEHVYSNIQNPFSISTYTFAGISYNAVLHIPKGTKEAYNQYENWTRYFSKVIEEGEEDVTTYTLSISATGNGSASYGGETIRGTTKTYTVNEGTSATISFTPDNGYRIKSLVVNNAAVTASTSYTVTVNANTTVSVEFEAIPPTTYTLSIRATGNGSASYDGTYVRGSTKSFTVNEGTKATITFTPDDGYQIKSLKVNNAAVTASSSYTTTINSDTSVEVEFEAKPVDPDIPKTYTLSIRAKGNGIATYNGETIRATTKTYTLEEGAKVSMTFTPDEGNQIKSLRVNGEYQTVTDKYEGTINADTSIKIDFEEIPVEPEPQTTYTLTIKATGNGIATYNGETIRGEEKTYTLEEGTKVSMTYTPDEGNQIKSLRVNGEYQTVTEKYEATITTDTSIAVEFEEKPVEPEPQTTYTLTIKAIGNGIATYSEEVVRDNTSTFKLDEGTTGTISFTPDEGYHIKSLSVNGSSIDIDTSYSFTMTSDVSVEVMFEVTIVDRDITIDGLNYEVISFEEHTLFLRAGDYGLTLVVPGKVTYQDEEWSVTGIKEDALDKCEDLAAIIWNPEATFKARVSNPNLLLYVKHDSYAPASFKNVVVNGYARAITLTDAQSGNNFYCPETFIAQSIVYMHNYSMKTGLNESRGWESIALPFDVQMISHSSKGEITPFANWTSESSTKPFWLYELTGNGFVETESIKANTPYIISMPNNGVYPNDYMLAGRVSFSAINAEVKKSDEMQTVIFSNHTFIPSFINHDAEATCYALNVNNDYENYEGSDNEGSKFILGLRNIHPFEAYMTSTSGTRSIDISEGMTTGIMGIEENGSLDKAVKVYDLSGRLIKTGMTMEAIKQELPSGVYIINNKKMIIK